DEASMTQWCNGIVANLTEIENGGVIYTASTVLDNERKVYLPSINVRKHGIDTVYLFSNDFFLSNDYQAIADLGSEINGLIEEGGFVQRGERVKEVDNFIDALNWIVGEAKRGLYIQRYKGLGEMNPEQLWETTMDPEQRRMLQVTIEDAVGADQLFTTLMGDQVEPRRNFIEANALNVANLDV
ncbi:MAG: DNA gyrase subunit B, partial [Shewanella sp.]|nr:DNA gyrase subunit B [Shewanella sp.]